MDKEASIIEIIQKMVRDNEPEEKIIQSLKSLGVTEEQSKRLLLIAQADTFTLLKSEIGKIVEKQTQEQQAKIEANTKNFVNTTLAEQKKLIIEDIKKETEKSKLAMGEEQKAFQANVKDTIEKIAKLNEEVYNVSEENKKMINTVQRDLSETKLKGIKIRRSVARNILLIAGFLSLIASIIVVVVSFASTGNIDFLTGAAIFSLIGAILVYLSLNL